MSDGMSIRVGFSPERFIGKVPSGQTERKEQTGQQESSITWPSGSDQIVVGSHVDKGAAGEVVSFKPGKRPDISSNVDQKDISGKSGDMKAAPDLTVLSLGGTLPGPSAPVVAGEAALLLQKNPNLTPAQLKDELTAMHQNQTIVVGAGDGNSTGSSRIVGWKDFVNDRPEPYDDHGQGTHVASILTGGGSSEAKPVQAPRVETDGTMVVFDHDGREIRLNSNGLPISQ